MYIDRLEDTYDRSFLDRIALMEVRLREIIVVPRWKQINGCQFIEHHDKVQFEREKEINNEFVISENENLSSRDRDSCTDKRKGSHME